MEKLRELGKFQLKPEILQLALEKKMESVNTATMTPTFIQNRKKRFELENKKLSYHGIFVSKYGPMGGSPRIQPMQPSPGNSINAVSGPLKKYAYMELEKRLDHFFGDKGLLLDIDIKACYFSLLLGLYPKETENLKKY